MPGLIFASTAVTLVHDPQLVIFCREGPNYDSMNGGVIPHTPIAVDFWKIRDCPQARVFFLTHLHGDHITGLTSSWNYPIYCSEITGTLLKTRLKISPDLVRTLQIGSGQIIYLDSEHVEQMTVTAIEANHCPGAVMLLMEGYFGTLLHTGDFRYSSSMTSTPPLVQYKGKIDTLYLDNTYCSPGCTFPTREKATQAIIDVIEAHPSHHVVIGMRNLGKESLLTKLAIQLQEYIYVPTKFYETLQLLEAPDVFKTNGDHDCRIQVVPFYTVSARMVARLNETQPTIAILPTAIYNGIASTPYANQNNVFVVPYSDHSSYTELMQFVSFLKPRRIIPVVKATSRGPFGSDISDRADMSCFDQYLTRIDHDTESVVIPKTVLAHMSNQFCNPSLPRQKGVKRKLSRVKRAISMSKHSQKGVNFHNAPLECKDSKEARHKTKEPTDLNDVDDRVNSQKEIAEINDADDSVNTKSTAEEQMLETTRANHKQITDKQNNSKNTKCIGKPVKSPSLIDNPKYFKAMKDRGNCKSSPDKNEISIDLTQNDDNMDNLTCIDLTQDNVNAEAGNCIDLTENNVMRNSMAIVDLTENMIEDSECITDICNTVDNNITEVSSAEVSTENKTNACDEERHVYSRTEELNAFRKAFQRFM